MDLILVLLDRPRPVRSNAFIISLAVVDLVTQFHMLVNHSKFTICLQFWKIAFSDNCQPDNHSDFRNSYWMQILIQAFLELLLESLPFAVNPIQFYANAYIPSETSPCNRYDGSDKAEVKPQIYSVSRMLKCHNGTKRIR